MPGAAADPLYPDSDGKPLAETGIHVVTIMNENLTAEGTATVGAVFVAALVAWGVFTTYARTEEPPPKHDGRSPNGNATIHRRTATGEIAIKTTQRLAGAIDSLTWNGKEFIDSADHGRQLQSAASFDCARPGEFWAECYNPTEAGSRDDGAGAVSTSSPGDYPFRVFVAVGTLNEVTHSLARLASRMK